MATVRITESELVRDVRAVLEKIQRGSEVIIEREDHRPVAVMRQPEPVGRNISECIALAKAYEEKIGWLLCPMKNSPETFRKVSTPMRNPSAIYGKDKAWV